MTRDPLSAPPGLWGVPSLPGSHLGGLGGLGEQRRPLPDPAHDLPEPSCPPWGSLPSGKDGRQGDSRRSSGLGPHRPTSFLLSVPRHPPPPTRPDPRVSFLSARALLPHLVCGGSHPLLLTPALSPLCLRGLLSLAGQGPLLSPRLVPWALVSFGVGVRGPRALCPSRGAPVVYTQSWFPRVWVSL